jgi:hypothetical protein
MENNETQNNSEENTLENNISTSDAETETIAENTNDKPLNIHSSRLMCK